MANHQTIKYNNLDYLFGNDTDWKWMDQVHKIESNVSQELKLYNEAI